MQGVEEKSRSGSGWIRLKFCCDHCCVIEIQSFNLSGFNFHRDNDQRERDPDSAVDIDRDPDIILYVQEVVTQSIW